MSKKYNIFGIIVSIIIIVYGIIFFFNISGYAISDFQFNENIDLNMFKQMQYISADIVKINNTLHNGIGVLISSTGFILLSYCINNLTKE